MFLPGTLVGRTVAVAGPAGPLTAAVAEMLAKAGAAVALCGSDINGLDDIAWEMAERHDCMVEVVEWDGRDVGETLRAAIPDRLSGADETAHAPALILIGGSGWTKVAAQAWASAGPVVLLSQGPGSAATDNASLIVAAPERNPVDVASWAAFLLSPAAQGTQNLVVHLRSVLPQDVE